MRTFYIRFFYFSHDLNDVPLSFTILVLLTFIVKEKEEVKLFWELRLGMFVFPNGASQLFFYCWIPPYLKAILFLNY